jgi:multicomponent Na+:H+ antiporter subunit F
VGTLIGIGLVLLAVGGAGFLWRLWHGPNLADRVVALDGLFTIMVTGITAWGAYTDRTTYLTVGVVVSLIAFLGTSAFARFIERRRA